MKNTSTIGARIVQFLSSMNLAISLLVVISIASIIGTVLKQNQPYADYQIKFGSFWFEVFKTLNLYDVYAAVWFLLILAFLLISTATCVGRTTPNILKEIRHYRESIQEKSLRAMKRQHNFVTEMPLADAQNLSERILKNQGFKFRVKTDEDHHVVAAMKGRANHWGYWFTHIGMIIILLGAGILDNGRLALMLGEWSGSLKPETRNIPSSEVPEISQLPATNKAYRGSVDVPEGSSANIIFLPVREGYLVQHLPFSVEVKDFRVEHYSTGMPKSFESDLIIRDKALDKPLEATISVNHPLIYKDVAIYQANFGDGGSEVNLRLLPFSTRYAAQDLTGNVFKDYTLTSSDKKYKLEITDFRLFNINDMSDKDGKMKKRNVGPSVTFKLRDATGQALEYQNYMSPIAIDNKAYLISGMRAAPNEPFRYLHIPLDAKGTPDRFMRFLSNLQNAELVKNSAVTTTRASLQGANVPAQAVETQVVESMVQLTQTFVERGTEGIMQDIAQRFPQDKRKAASEAFMKVLNASLRAVYQETLAQEGIKSEPDDAQWSFLDDSILAIDKVSAYGSPWFVQLANFKQIEASGLQITRSPGQSVVYFGCVLLVIGVFLLFYVAHRRIWVWLKPLDNNRTELVIAGSSNRNQPDFEHDFSRLHGIFQQAMTPNEVKHVPSTGND